MTDYLILSASSISDLICSECYASVRTSFKSLTSHSNLCQTCLQGCARQSGLVTLLDSTSNLVASWVYRKPRTFSCADNSTLGVTPCLDGSRSGHWMRSIFNVTQSRTHGLHLKCIIQGLVQCYSSEQTRSYFLLV